MNIEIYNGKNEKKAIRLLKKLKKQGYSLDMDPQEMWEQNYEETGILVDKDLNAVECSALYDYEGTYPEVEVKEL